MVDISSSRSTITLENGEEVMSDFIVGADGVGGIARSVVSGRSPDTSGNRFLTIACTLPCDDFSKDPDLATVLNETSVCVFSFGLLLCRSLLLSTSCSFGQGRMYSYRDRWGSVPYTWSCHGTNRKLTIQYP